MYIFTANMPGQNVHACQIMSEQFVVGDHYFEICSCDLNQSSYWEKFHVSSIGKTSSRHSLYLVRSHAAHMIHLYDVLPPVVDSVMMPITMGPPFVLHCVMSMVQNHAHARVSVVYITI